MKLWQIRNFISDTKIKWNHRFKDEERSPRFVLRVRLDDNVLLCADDITLSLLCRFSFPQNHLPDEWLEIMHLVPSPLNTGASLIIEGRRVE